MPSSSQIQVQPTAGSTHPLMAWLLVLILILIPLPGLSKELQPPQQLIKDTAETLITILERDKQRMNDEPAYVYQLANEILVPHVDMYRISQLALGKYWRRSTKEQRQRFAAEFRRMLVRTYASAMKQFRGDARIEFLPMRTKNGSEDDVVVSTKMSQAGSQPVKVDYRLHRKRGKWLTYDVKVEGISLVTNYRSNFTRQIRTNGIDKLIERIKEMNDNRTQLAQKIAINQ